MRRGEVRWHTFKPPDKRRPVLILTRDSAIGYLDTITVASITTTIRDNASELYLTPEDGLYAECVANMDALQTVPKGRLGSLITVLSPERMKEAELAIAFALGLDWPELRDEHHE